MQVSKGFNKDLAVEMEVGACMKYVKEEESTRLWTNILWVHNIFQRISVNRSIPVHVKYGLRKQFSKYYEDALGKMLLFSYYMCRIH